MCKFWNKKGCNHHFPELNHRQKAIMSLQGFFASKSICFLVGGLVILTGFAYLLQTNSSATKGYQMRDLEKRITVLQADNAKMNLEYVRLQSMSNVLASAQSLNLVPADNMEVVNSISPAMAYQR
jgi:hypothetical protein